MSEIPDVQLTERQQQAFNALNKGSVDVMYGGAKGGGKSFFLCWYVYMWAINVIKRYGLKPSKHPIHAAWIGRKQSVDFTATTLQTWQKVIPSSAYKLVGGTERHPKHILINNTMAVDYGGLDKQETINKFNSAEYALIAIDQAEETTRDDVSVLMASRRLTIKNKPLHYKGLFTANPAQCWLKDEFINYASDNKIFVQALPSDNPYLPQDYINTLKDSFGHRPELLEAYLHGKWDALDGADQIIKGIWIDRALQNTLADVEQKVFI